MANEFKHANIGTSLTQDEWQDITTHIADGQTADDILYFDGTYWKRLAVAASRIIAKLAAGGIVAATPAEIKTLIDVSKVVGLAAEEVVVTDLNRTASLDWTDLDLTASTSATAKFALLVFIISIDSITAGSANYVTLGTRKNGQTTPTMLLQIDGVSCAAGSGRYSFKIVELDAGQVCEYIIGIGGTAQIDSYIKVVGYIE